MGMAHREQSAPPDRLGHGQRSGMREGIRSIGDSRLPDPADLLGAFTNGRKGSRRPRALHQGWL